MIKIFSATLAFLLTASQAHAQFNYKGTWQCLSAADEVGMLSTKGNSYTFEGSTNDTNFLNGSGKLLADGALEGSLTEFAVRYEISADGRPTLEFFDENDESFHCSFNG